MKNKGFTLVEILVVITLLGILITFATTSVMRYVNDSRESAKEQTKQNLEDAALAYALKHDIRIPDICALDYIVSDDASHKYKLKTGCTKESVKVQKLIDENLFSDPSDVLDKTGEVLFYKYNDPTVNDKPLKAFVSEKLFNEIVAESKFTPNVMLDGGDLSEEIQIVQGRTVGDLPKPTKPGYVFAGWYLEETFNNRVDDSTIIDDKDTKLYARWVDENFKNYIASLVGSDPSVVIDNTIDKNIRFTGKEVNNYLLFNCSNYDDESTCELWRIVGIINGAVKIVRDTPLSQEYAYHENKEYINDWSDTTLYEYFDQTYIRSMKGNTFIGIMDDGPFTSNKDVTTYDTAQESYTKEKSKAGYEYLGLLSYSEYMYSMDKAHWNGDSYYSEYSWMSNDDNQWLQNTTKTTNIADYNTVYYYTHGVIFDDASSGAKMKVKPVTYLKQNLVITNADTADGSRIKPYRINKK